MRKKCNTPGCNNKTRGGGAVDCNTCHSTKVRRLNPVRAAYRNLRNNSKRRGITFDLTFEQFRKFAIETDYMRGKGKLQKSYTIDRIEAEKGYVEGNLQVLTNQANTIKNKTLEKYLTVDSIHWFVTTNRNEVYDTPF